MAEKLIEINADDVVRVANELKEIPDKILPAIARVVNRTMDGAITQIKKEVSSEYTIKQKDVADSFTKKRGGGRTRATADNLTSTATSAGGQTGLYKFKHLPAKTPPKQRYRKPVRVKIKKQGGEIVVRHNKNLAFMQDVETNNKRNESDPNLDVIFAREGKKRLPIKKLHALSVPQMISDKDGRKPTIVKVQKAAAERLEKEIPREINYRLQKAGKKK